MKSTKKNAAAGARAPFSPSGKHVTSSAERRTKRPTAQAISKRKNGRAKVIPDWKPLLDCYLDQIVLRFETKTDLHAAIELLWTDELRLLPHGTSDGRSIIIPAEALPYFVKAGLKFTTEKPLDSSDFTPEELARMRGSRK